MPDETPEDTPATASPSCAPPCGGPRVRAIPPGEDRERLMCPDCGYIAYQNPLIVVGAVATWEDGRILLCRRAIEPRKGFWTLPAGFMEERESTREGAAREAWEEARARIGIDHLLAIYDIPRISQVQMIFSARLLSPDVAPGPESLEVGLFAWEDIPWDEIAFPTVHWALREHRERRDRGTDCAPAVNPTPEALARWERML
ncbi:NUDIX hydrolase [Azospirillum picis]|uniref:ADP-ribose pyrophosphatase YjhB (NUDIX family) n=1 Tax=Azospirillum picis TaxID=488438 RepID=A0ABU0MKP6_9PROT|nr:NUDIX hydrolase [Azospirillum picis]MBP2300171.1 ADP-ribose pyrophosphatase YjhB (NUDIX family) [Azospirillum picis]MDQ0533987.1 ADP-ribose pyrophosphatase YjhB (NUDIX family) [Azospirillum picis]